jgi:putative transposase
VVIPGCLHHVTQRGNNRQDVFFVDDDRRAYLDILAEQSERFGLAVEGYCLMGNHVHLIAAPASAEALAKAVGRTHFRYTQYVNRLHGRSGHLWQNRFYSCPLDEEHFWTAMAYVERNPVRAKLVRRAWEYPWSSAAAHVGGADPSPLLDLSVWARRMAAGGDWRETLARPGDPETTAALRRNTATGRPLGSDRFLSKLETALNRRLRPLPVGRPRKKRS